MSDNKTISWTAAQQDAIDARGGPLLVSAAAGSGKTAVLSQRVINIITDRDNPTDIDRFLIVTFTNLAADEMKQRIRAKLDALLEDDPFNEHLLRQELLLEKANISTIDGYCSALVREFFYTLDIPCDFRIADEQEVNVLQNTAIGRVFERRYESEDPQFMLLLDLLSGSYDDVKLKSVVTDLYNFLRAQPFPERWMQEKLAMYDESDDPAHTIWGREIIINSKATLDNAVVQIRRACESIAKEPGFEKANVRIFEEAASIERICQAFENGTWDDIVSALHDIKFDKLTFNKKINKVELNEEQIFIRENAKLCRNLAKDIITKELSPMFKRTSRECIEEIKDAKRFVSAVFGLVREFSSEYEGLKRERLAADYSDLEHWALELLVKDIDSQGKPVYSDIARDISQRFDFVMVDEYQDVNRLQETLFTALSAGGRTLFTVGDVKQSIYGFRQAMPEIFIERKNSSALYDRSSPMYPARINLDANFRSRRGVTDCVNFVFKNLMSRAIGGLEYTEEESLKPEAAYPENNKCAAQFHLLGVGDCEDITADEARYIGGLIKDIVNSETVYENGEYRRARLSDICIIMRKANKLAPTYVKKLQEMGISAVSESSDSFLSQAEVRLCVSLLRAIENPARDIPLAAALISPVFAFGAEDIAKWRSENKYKGLFEILLEKRKEDARAEYFCDMFERLRMCSASMSSYRLLRRIYEETLLPEIVTSADEGEYRRRNLLLLLEYAKQFEASGFTGLSGFVNFIDKITESGNDLSSAQRAPGAYDDSVKILTIHKSKGLEYPFCIVSGLSSKFNTSDTRSEIIVHGRMGVGTPVYGGSKPYRYNGMIKAAVANAIKRDNIAEELRMLYVAMTRAKEKLIMIAAVKDTDAAVKSAAKKLVFDDKVAPYSVNKAVSFTDMMLYCLLASRDGSVLRDKAESAIQTADDDISRWEIFVSECSRVIVADEEGGETEYRGAESALVNDISGSADEAETAQELENIKTRLARSYKYEKECFIPVKVSASAAAERESGLIYSADAHPAFMNKGGLSAAERGTAVHEFVRYCDFTAARVSIDSEKQRLANSGRLTKRQCDAVSEEKVRRFLGSELMDKMLSSDRLEREYQFMIEIPAGFADKTLEKPYSEEKIVLQGAIDCLYEKNGQITIVDYKTDIGASAEELAERYLPQLRLYKYAAEQIFHKPVERCVLWSFALGEEVVVSC